MSERTQAPRPGGRAAEPERGTTGRRSAGPSRAAEARDAADRTAAARRSAARGARRFAEADGPAGPSDTRQSGIRREPSAGRDTDRVRGKARTSEDGRLSGGGPDRVRGKARTSEEGRGRKAPLRGRAADTVGGRGRTAERAAGRGPAGSPAARGPLDRGKPAGRTAVGAPVDGTAALQVEVAPVEVTTVEVAAGEPMRAAEAAPAPQLRVAPPVPVSAPRAPFVAAVLGVVVVGVLGILLINTKTNENSFRIADLQKQNTALDNQRQDLENQLVQVSSIGNLDAAARRLGLVKADKPAILRLPDGKRFLVPVPADGELSPTSQDAKTETTGTGTGQDAEAGTDGTGDAPPGAARQPSGTGR